MKLIDLHSIKKYTSKRKNHSDYTYGGWYMIRNKLNNKIYIGKSIEYMSRLRSHITFKNPKLDIDKSIKNYGVENFEFYLIDKYINHSINFFTRRKETYIENKLIGSYKSYYPNGYNKTYYERIRSK